MKFSGKWMILVALLGVIPFLFSPFMLNAAGNGDQDRGTLKLNKTLFKPSEEIKVFFVGQADFENNAWIGIIPSTVPHGKESDADAHDIAYQYLSGQLKGEKIFQAPNRQGDYDMRMFNTDNNGIEITSITFQVSGGTSDATLRVEPEVAKPGETLRVYFTAPGTLPDNAWIGLIPSKIPHGDEGVNDQHDIAYKYLSGKTSGVMEFQAPDEPGSYDFRLNESDDGGKELASVSFEVKK